jgi:hypothetical protein
MPFFTSTHGRDSESTSYRDPLTAVPDRSGGMTALRVFSTGSPSRAFGLRGSILFVYFRGIYLYPPTTVRGVSQSGGFAPPGLGVQRTPRWSVRSVDSLPSIG